MCSIKRQQNAFIKAITGKSYGTQPHSHYSLSGTSHLHLTWCLSFQSVSAISCLVHLFTRLKVANPELYEESLYKGLCKSASCCTVLLGQTWKTMVKDFLGFSKLLNKKVKKENPRFCIKSVVKLDNLLSSCTYYGSNVVILVTFISQTVISSI